MKKTIKNFEDKAVKNIQSLKGGILGKRRDGQEEKYF